MTIELVLLSIAFVIMFVVTCSLSRKLSQELQLAWEVIQRLGEHNLHLMSLLDDAERELLNTAFSAHTRAERIARRVKWDRDDLKRELHHAKRYGDICRKNLKTLRAEKAELEGKYEKVGERCFLAELQLHETINV